MDARQGQGGIEERVEKKDRYWPEFNQEGLKFSGVKVGPKIEGWKMGRRGEMDESRMIRRDI